MSAWHSFVHYLFSAKATRLFSANLAYMTPHRIIMSRPTYLHDDRHISPETTAHISSHYRQCEPSNPASSRPLPVTSGNWADTLRFCRSSASWYLQGRQSRFEARSRDSQVLAGWVRLLGWLGLGLAVQLAPRSPDKLMRQRLHPYDIGAYVRWIHACVRGCMDAWMHGCMDACFCTMFACCYACLHGCVYRCCKP